MSASVDVDGILNERETFRDSFESTSTKAAPAHSAASPNPPDASNTTRPTQ